LHAGGHLELIKPALRRENTRAQLEHLAGAARCEVLDSIRQGAQLGVVSAARRVLVFVFAWRQHAEQSNSDRSAGAFDASVMRRFAARAEADRARTIVLAKDAAMRYARKAA